MTGVGGVLLTGGSSRRLGVDKASLLFEGETLADRATRYLTKRCDRVVEVGPGITRLRSVRESPPGSGPLAGLAAGVAALGSDAPVGSVVLLACDLPYVEDVLDALVTVADMPSGAVIPVDSDGRRQYVCARYGPDALIRTATLVAGGERSLRAMVGLLAPETVVDLAGFAPGTFADVDVPADARRLGIDLPR